MIIELDAESQPSNDHTAADTPTHTSDTTIHCPGPKGNFSVEPGIESVPWPHRTFIIRNRASDRILAREGGNLVLKEAAELAPCGWRWTCVEHPQGWFGFRETSSGTYLGRDNQGGFRAWATQQKGWEQFDVRRHPDGGYQLLSINWWNRQRMAVDMKTHRVVEIAGPGDTVGAVARWDFVQVE
jgi:hypothetical protein